MWAINAKWTGTSPEGFSTDSNGFDQWLSALHPATSPGKAASRHAMIISRMETYHKMKSPVQHSFAILTQFVHHCNLSTYPPQKPRSYLTASKKKRTGENNSFCSAVLMTIALISSLPSMTSDLSEAQLSHHLRASRLAYF